MLKTPIYASSWCGKLFCTSFTLIIAILISNAYIPLLPFGALYIFLYLLLVSVISVWLTCVVIQKFLKRTKPLEYNNEYITQWLCSTSNSIKNQQSTLPDLEERISEFANDIEKFYIAKWFKHITEDVTFGNESRAMIADVTRRFLQIVILVDGKKLLHGTLLILLKHLKEYRRARKRYTKIGVGDIEQAYRYAHAGSKNSKSQEYFLHKLTESFLRQFINWELWNSLPCRTLVAVLSRKLINYLLIYVSKPGFINWRVLNANENVRNELDLEKYGFVSVSGLLSKKVVGKVEETFTPRDSPSKRLEKRQKIAQHDLIDAAVKKSDEKAMKKTNQLIVSEPVKIHEAKVANKTWRNSSDLECVSLGQDLLADEKNKLWEGMKKKSIFSARISQKNNKLKYVRKNKNTH